MQQILAEASSILERSMAFAQDQALQKRLEEAAGILEDEHIKEKQEVEELQRQVYAKRLQLEAAEREVELLKQLLIERNQNLELLASLGKEEDRLHLAPLTSAKTSTRFMAQQQELARLAIQQANYDNWMLEADKVKRQPTCCKCQFASN
mmetsp:Transcript_25625/g.44838  ORF Transcript_25625/g.44838 Transcript_25625/m.44838 type:complete len:150 (-) Transcript_25625:2408-2857(-)